MVQNTSESTPRLPLIPGEITSQGDGLNELINAFSVAQPDKRFTPLLTQANMLPHEFIGLRVLPAVTYGVTSKKLNSGAVELLPGTDSMLAETFGSDYFNPHGPIKQRASNLIDSAKHPRQSKASSFRLPSYVLGNENERHLFIGGSDNDLETLEQEDYALALATAYELGSVVVGNVVVFGNIYTDFGKTSLPSLIREIGQTIGTTDGLMGSSRLAMLNHAKHNLSIAKSPDYRPWLDLRKNK